MKSTCGLKACDVGELTAAAARHAAPCRHATSARLLLVSYLASGVVHVAGAVLIHSLLGGAPVRVVPPPHGVNSVESLASNVITIEASQAQFSERDSAPPPVRLELPDADCGEFLQPQPTPVVRVRALAPADVADLAMRELSPPQSIPLPHPSLPWNRADDSVEPDAVQEERASELRTQRARQRTVVEHAVSPAQAAAQASPASKQLSGQQTDTPPRKQYSPAPEYPPEALAARIAGRVVLRADVDERGRVVNVVVLQSSGTRSLDEAARKAVRQWRFEPARRTGAAVSIQVDIPIRFVIEDADY